ncbi:MAG: SRPBCC family protein [Myxococcota bacterium]
MFKNVLIALVVLVGGLCAYIATRPAEFRVERSATIAAPASIVFTYVSDFHRWDVWSPWNKLDPAMKKTFEGAPAGKGAIYAWAGNDQVGEGRMTLEEVKQDERVDIKLEFLEPWAATHRTEFTLRPVGDTVTLTWAMSGKNDFLGKAMSLFMSMDAMIGKDFEAGLAELKKAAEAEAKKAAEAKAAAEAAPHEGLPTPEVAN